MYVPFFSRLPSPGVCVCEFSPIGVDFCHHEAQKEGETLKLWTVYGFIISLDCFRYIAKHHETGALVLAFIISLMPTYDNVHTTPVHVLHGVWTAIFCTTPPGFFPRG